MKLSVQLVTWNGVRYLPALFESLKNQTFRDWRLHLFDNGSTDDTIEYLQRHKNSIGVPMRLTCSRKNLGFVGGHNRLFQKYGSDSDLVLLLNQDMTLDPRCIEYLVRFMQAHPHAAACTARLMQMNDRSRIDTLGLKPCKNGRVVDWMNGKVWRDEVFWKLPNATEEYRCHSEGVSEASDDIISSSGDSIAPASPPLQDDRLRYIEVFGVSGALPLFRSLIFKFLPGDDPLFDAQFFSYKEDVDLAWRLRRMGHKSYVLVDAVAYHDRSAAGPGSGDDFATARHWIEKSKLVRKYSYRNHWLVIIKNVALSPSMLWFEFKKLIYLLFREPGIVQFALNLGMIKSALRRRRIFNTARRVHPIELKRWMT